MEDVEKYLSLIITAVFIVVQLLAKAKKERAATPSFAEPEIARPKPAKAKKPSRAKKPDKGRKTAVPSGVASAARRADDARRKLVARLDVLDARAADLARAVALERPNRRFADVLSGFVPARTRELRQALLRGPAAPGAPRAADAIERVIDAIEELVVQRRDPRLLPELGDADTFAEACYAPVLAFARAEGLPLRSGHPATQLGDFDLSIWTGFIPTSIAPIFLPRGFFASTTLWPAIAHEIGHDFLASVEPLEPCLRRELDLPGPDVPASPFAPGASDVDPSYFRRIFGAWLEEIFCDVFGTLMCGPAYVVTMSEVFAAREHPHEILLMSTDRTGMRHDTHPPAHLRVIVGCMVLERAGFHADAKRIWRSWTTRHAELGEDIDWLLLPVGNRLIGLPAATFATIAGGVVERLYCGPIAALSGFGLQDVSGLDYGPHEHMEAQRARDALLAGQVPAARDPRAVIAGAVLAAQQKPDLELRILTCARAAIPALGTGERRPDAFSPAAAPSGAAGAVSLDDRQTLVDALILREILAPPRALAGRRGGGARRWG